MLDPCDAPRWADKVVEERERVARPRADVEDVCARLEEREQILGSVRVLQVFSGECVASNQE